jgi:hypothetical protein
MVKKRGKKLMLHHIFTLSLLVSTLFISPQDKPVSPVSKTTNNNLTTNNNPSIGSNAPVLNIEYKPQFISNMTSVIEAIGIKVGDITVIIKQAIRDHITKKNYNYAKNIIKQLLWDHRYHIAGGAVASSYSATSLLLIADYHHLNNSMFWAYWKHQSTFEDLCAIPQKELAKELMLAIGQHHFNKDNPTDLAYPLITFIKDIDWEINTIKRYIATTKILKQLYLMPIFPTNEKKLTRATKMLERALFIKHIFLSWLADYNLTSTEKLNAN